MGSDTALRSRAWILGILGGCALLALILSAAYGPEAMAGGAALRALGVDPLPCPGCPLCGMSRAFACVTHGELSRALEFNRGVVLAYPAAFALALGGPAFLVRDLWKRRA
jgi:hypothetical protein